MIEIISYSDKFKAQTISFIFDILENEFGHHSKSGRPDLHNISNYYQKNGGNFWLAVDNGNVVGTIALSNYGDKNGFLERFYVKKDLRKHGIGRKLFYDLMEFAHINKFENIFLSTWDGTNDAQNFYNKNGFKRIDLLPENIAARSGKDNIFYQLKL